MSRDQIDRALERLKGERERITTVLFELEAHQGYQLLKGTRLAGATQRCWNELNGRMTTLWKLFDAHGRVLGEAQELRARHSRPGQAQLAELTRLLTGTSVELVSQEIPLEERTLLGPTGEWLSLDAVVARMTPLYEDAAGTIAAVDGVWSVLLTRLGEAEDTSRTVEALLGSLGIQDAEFDRVGRRLAEVREAARTDPLSLASGGQADTSRIDEVGDDLTALRRRLEDAARLRDEHDDRMRGIEATIGLVKAAEEEAVQARDLVLSKIASPALPDLPGLAAPLRDRLAVLGTLRGEGRWIDLAARAAGLERAAATALDQARTTTGLITGLLERRDELRGRLDAYHAKAGRLGLAEDAGLAELHQQAHDLLWTSPCDLRGATATLAKYQRAIGSHAEGTGR
ncbi:MAG: hypothetical protein JWR24_1168 [Actinoallomurus sp.]|nr:hypothetical protein [Actinoallomurus sp.]